MERKSLASRKDIELRSLSSGADANSTRLDRNSAAPTPRVLGEPALTDVSNLTFSPAYFAA